MSHWISARRVRELGNAVDEKAAFIAQPTGGTPADLESRAAILAIRQLLIDLKLMEPS